MNRTSETIEQPVADAYRTAERRWQRLCKRVAAFAEAAFPQFPRNSMTYLKMEPVHSDGKAHRWPTLEFQQLFINQAKDLTPLAELQEAGKRYREICKQISKLLAASSF